MPTPAGFDDPRLAALPQAPNPYLGPTFAIHGAAENLVQAQQAMYGQARDPGAYNVPMAPLMFGEGAYTREGEPILTASAQTPGTRGHVSELLNFHGSPAPWILLFALLALGALHVQGKAGVSAGR